MLRARLTKRPPYLPYDFRSRFRLLDPSNKHAHRVLAVLVASRAHISTGLGLRTCGPPAPNWPSWRVAFTRSYAMPMAVWSLQHVLRQTQGPWRCGLSVALKCLTPFRIFHRGVHEGSRASRRYGEAFGFSTPPSSYSEPSSSAYWVSSSNEAR